MEVNDEGRTVKEEMEKGGSYASRITFVDANREEGR